MKKTIYATLCILITLCSNAMDHFSQLPSDITCGITLHSGSAYSASKALLKLRATNRTLRNAIDGNKRSFVNAIAQTYTIDPLLAQIYAGTKNEILGLYEELKNINCAKKIERLTPLFEMALTHCYDNKKLQAILQLLVDHNATVRLKNSVVINGTEYRPFWNSLTKNTGNTINLHKNHACHFYAIYKAEDDQIWAAGIYKHGSAIQRIRVKGINNKENILTHPDFTKSFSYKTIQPVQLHYNPESKKTIVVSDYTGNVINFPSHQKKLLITLFNTDGSSEELSINNPLKLY